jgi:hypothetical protein
MELLHRRAMEAFMVLKDSPNENATALFTQKIHQDLDDYMFFMFLIFQATQARMYNGLTYSIINLGVILEQMNILATIIIVSIVAYWFIDLQTKK